MTPWQRRHGPVGQDLGDPAGDGQDGSRSRGFGGDLDADVDHRDEVALGEPVEVVADLEPVDARDQDVALPQRLDGSGGGEELGDYRDFDGSRRSRWPSGPSPWP